MEDEIEDDHQGGDADRKIKLKLVDQKDGAEQIRLQIAFFGVVHQDARQADGKGEHHRYAKLAVFGELLADQFDDEE